MKSIWSELADYAFSILGLEIKISAWNGSEKLPRYLTGLYQFRQTRILDRHYILASPVSNEDQTPAAVRAHFDKIMGMADCEVVYIHSGISTWNRKRFIEQKISFVIPGNQMYLPLLGLDLREYMRIPQKETGIKPLTPSAQTIALKALASGDKNEWTGAEFANLLGVTLMTVHRSFAELEPLGTFDIRMAGKRKVLGLKTTRRDAWAVLQKGLTSPLTKKIFVARKDVPPFAVTAGISALARVTNIAGPETPEFAVSQNRWKEWITQHTIKTIPVADKDTAVIEVWRQDPCSGETAGMADLLPVCLTLRDSDDDRVQQAVEHVLEARL